MTGLWMMFSLLSLALAALVYAANPNKLTTTNTSVTNSLVPTGGQIPLIFHHRSALQKRQRRQYSSERASPYDLHFLPYHVHPSLKPVRIVSQNSLRGSKILPLTTSAAIKSGINEASSLTYPPPTPITDTSSSIYNAYPPKASITFSANQPPAYMQPPNGLPRESGGGSRTPESLPNNSNYYYPPRMPLPLSQPLNPVIFHCFYNPTGYACCNAQLNDLMVETYTELEAKPTFHTCNINAIASMLQLRAEKKFNVTFETIAGFEDFAQKVHFNSDLICKIELGGKFMLAYGTAKPNTGGSGSSFNKYTGDTLKRHRRTVYGVEDEMPENHISQSHSMWI